MCNKEFRALTQYEKKCEKCVKYADRSQSPAQPKSQKKRTRTPGGGGCLVAQNAEIWG